MLKAAYNYNQRSSGNILKTHRTSENKPLSAGRDTGMVGQDTAIESRDSAMTGRETGMSYKKLNRDSSSKMDFIMK